MRRVDDRLRERDGRHRHRHRFEAKRRMRVCGPPRMADALFDALWIARLTELLTWKKSLRVAVSTTIVEAVGRLLAMRTVRGAHDGVGGDFVLVDGHSGMGTGEVLEMASSKTLGGRLKSAARRAAKRVLILGLAACLLFVAARAAWRVDYGKQTLELIRWLRRDVSTQTGCSILATLTAVATPMFLTTTPLNVGAGAVYGVWLGSLVSLVGATAGGAACFVAARFGPGRAWARRKISSSPLLMSLDHAVSDARGAAWIVMLSRLSPIFPFAACSFAFGACRVSARHFLAGTAVGLAPGTAMTSYIGWNLYDVTKLSKVAASERVSGVASDPDPGASVAATYRLCVASALTIVSSVGLAARVRYIIKKAARDAVASGSAGIGGGLNPIAGLGGVGGLGGLRSLQETNNKKKKNTRGVLAG